MKIIILSLPHTLCTPTFNSCAFTLKAYHLCRMMTRLGHEVIHIGNEIPDGDPRPECTKNIACMPHKDWSAVYQHPGSDYYDSQVHEKNAIFNARWAANCRDAIDKECKEPWSAIVCCPWGGAQASACHHLPQFVVESGIGYKYVWAKYRVFESYAWLHMIMGRDDLFHGDNWYHVVIPNAFDPDMFAEALPWEVKRQYGFLYMGRLNEDKGIGIAIDASREAKQPLTIVGQGDPARFLKDNPHVSYLPPVGVEKRKELMSHARGVFCASRYVEPFCGVSVESLCSGTPVIATDFGVFSETIPHGHVGYRCRTMEQFVWAAKNIENIDPHACREWAIANYSLDRVAKMYDEYFHMIMDLNEPEGWYKGNHQRTELDWLKKDHSGLQTENSMVRG